MNLIEIEFYEGTTYKNKRDDYWTSGIDAGSVHGNMIEVYGETEQDAITKRNFVFNALQHYQDLFKIAAKIQCHTSG